MAATFRRLLLVLCLVNSFYSYATLITSNGYTLDTTTNIVTDGELEWMQWSQTTGTSISSALASYSGWRLATNTEMSTLYNTFFAPKIFPIDELAFTSRLYTYGATDTNLLDFIDLFGVTQSQLASPSDCVDDTLNEYYCILNNHTWSRALYGSDADGNGKYNTTMVRTEYTLSDKYYDNVQSQYEYSSLQVKASAVLYGATSSTFNDNVAISVMGVALVRNGTESVPEPSTLAIFALGMIGLASRRFKKQP